MRRHLFLAALGLSVLSLGGVRLSRPSQWTENAKLNERGPSISTKDDPIHVLVTVCNGGPSMEERRSFLRYREAVDLLTTIDRYGMGKPSMECINNSTAADSSCERIIIHIFTDDVETLKKQFLQMPPTPNLIDRLDVRVYPMPAPKEGSDFNKFRTCASSRLYATHLFEASASGGGNETSTISSMPRRVLYLDTDTLVTTNLRKLWESSNAAFDGNPEALFAMSSACLLRPEMGPYFHTGYEGENATGPDGSTHLVYLFPKGTCAGYNSGVLFVDLHRWQHNNFHSMVAEQESYARERGFEMPYGDNGILNAMSARFPDRFVELPCYWNVIIDSLDGCFPKYQANGGGILHVQYKNRLKFHGATSPATALHNYLVRANDTVDYLAGEFDMTNTGSEIYEAILRQMIQNRTVWGEMAQPTMQFAG